MATHSSILAWNNPMGGGAQGPMVHRVAKSHTRLGTQALEGSICPLSGSWGLSDRNFFFFYCSGFCHTLKWNSHGFTCVPHPDPPSHLPLHPIPLGLPSVPDPSAWVTGTLKGHSFCKGNHEWNERKIYWEKIFPNDITDKGLILNI